jgi:hypothetical protein
LTLSLSPDVASQFARIALGHVTQEYPHKLDHVLGSDADLTPPRAQHPIFHGSYDWHSCVHGYWTLARLYRQYQGRPECARVRALFDRMLTSENVTGEIAYLSRPLSRGFERPYGWGWALALTAELARHASPEGQRWAAALRPFGQAFADRYMAFLPLADYPVRSGVHSSTAFAAALALDYATVCADAQLRDALTARLILWFGQDRDAQAWEPNGEDFLSATLMEAEVMRRVMPRDAYRMWLAGFLPKLALRKPASLFAPARVSDRSDGKIAHLDGLNLSRAWCFRGIASALAEDDPARIACLEAANAHIAAALAHVAGDYMGEHWLATFAVLALDGL